MSANEKFNEKTASLTEMNRELKRLASRKCRAKSEKEKAVFTAEYEKLAKIKSERFTSAKKTYFTMSVKEIEELDLETTVKAIKSLQSRKCLYPQKREETEKIEQIFRDHREKLIEKARLEELLKKYGQ